MEIRFSKEQRYPWTWVWDCIESKPHDCFASLSSATPQGVRFKLLDASGNRAATEAQHDAVIRSLLTQDPQATIRTARAVYEGLADYEAQRKARVGT